MSSQCKESGVQSLVVAKAIPTNYLSVLISSASSKKKTYVQSLYLDDKAAATDSKLHLLLFTLHSTFFSGCCCLQVHIFKQSIKRMASMISMNESWATQKKRNHIISSSHPSLVPLFQFSICRQQAERPHLRSDGNAAAIAQSNLKVISTQLAQPYSALCLQQTSSTCDLYSTVIFSPYGLLKTK